MCYRNATVFVIPRSTVDDLRELIAQGDDSGSRLQQSLAECALKPVGGLELSSAGFVSPYGDGINSLFQRVRADGVDALAMTVATETRVLPTAAVNKALADKLKALEEQEGRKAGGRTRKRIKEDVVMEMLPKAFVQPGRTEFHIDLERGRVIVDSSSSKVAEAAMSELRRALGSFPSLPVNCETTPRAVLTGWIAGHPLPADFALGDECELKDAADSGSVIRAQRQELTSEEIAKCLEAGKQVTRLGVVVSNNVSAVIGEDMVLRKIKLLNGAVEKLEQSDREDVNAEIDARLLLTAAEIGPVLDAVADAFKWTKAE